MKSRDFLIATLAVQVLTWVAIFIDISVIRQILVFLCFIFIPGFILLRLLKLRNLDLAGTLIFSVGLSVAFLMLIGFLINDILPAIGFSKPLSQVNTIVITSGALLSLSLLSYIQDADFEFGLPRKLEKKVYLVILFIIFLSVTGNVMLNVYQNSSLLLLMIASISILTLLSTIYFKSLRPEFCIFILLAISVSLLLQKSLVSNYVHGFDIHPEYYISKLAENNSYWDSTAVKGSFEDYNSMLSIGVLPVLYSNLFNLELTWIFKIVYPLIYSLVPLGAYKLARMHFGTKIAFLSTFFFMANYDYFTQPVSNAKQMIAELFFVLLLFLILSRNQKTLSKMLCFVFFSFGLITSHYGTSYIFLFLILFAWVSMFLLKKREGRKIPLTFVVLFAAMSLSWFIYVSEAASFERILFLGNVVYNSLSEFFNPSSRGQTVLTAFGLTESPSFWHTISRVLFYATEALIIFGFISLIVRKRRTKLNTPYFMIISANLTILLMTVALPSFAGSMGTERFYGVVLLVLAPLCILGGKTVLDKVFALRIKHWGLILILAVLLPFFLFQTGFVYEVARDSVPSSVSLSLHRMGETPYISYGLLHERDVFGAKWLSEYTDAEHARMYNDVISQMFVLASYTSYGTINQDKVVLLTNVTNPASPGFYVYLGQHTVIDGVIVSWRWQGGTFNATEISSIFENSNKIYSNGASEIYENKTPTH